MKISLYSERQQQNAKQQV